MEKDGLPWRRIAPWEMLFQSQYFFRFVSLDILLSARNTGVEFGELKFGETDLSTLKMILAQTDIGPENLIIDLGCGRGRAAFLFHFLSGARVKAVDLIDSFIKIGNRLARWTRCPDQVQFKLQSFLETDISQADLLYACASCITQETRDRLAERIRDCKAGCVLASVGWKPDYPWLELMGKFEGQFSWGQAPVYLSYVRAHPSQPISKHRSHRQDPESCS